MLLLVQSAKIHLINRYRHKSILLKNFDRIYYYVISYALNITKSGKAKSIRTSLGKRKMPHAVNTHSINIENGSSSHADAIVC